MSFFKALSNWFRGTPPEKTPLKNSQKEKIDPSAINLEDGVGLTPTPTEKITNAILDNASPDDIAEDIRQLGTVAKRFDSDRTELIEELKKYAPRQDGKN